MTEVKRYHPLAATCMYTSVSAKLPLYCNATYGLTVTGMHNLIERIIFLVVVLLQMLYSQEIEQQFSDLIAQHVWVSFMLFKSLKPNFVLCNTH